MTVEQRKTPLSSSIDKPVEENFDKISDISLKKIHDAIPSYLFERSTFKSILYLIHDITLASIVYLVAYYAIEKYVPNFLSWPVIITYWLIQGTVCTGIWVIAHECGHQAFSPSEKINDTFGLVLHSFLLTPYHSWKISHAQHHRSTGHMTRDMVFVPLTKKQYLDKRESMLSMVTHGLRVITGNGIQKDDKDDKCIDTTNIINDDTGHTGQQTHQSIINEEYITDVPILAFLVQIPSLITMLLFGWPAYLLFNVTGQKYDRWTSHFTPKSAIFNESHDKEIIISNIGLLMMLSILAYASYLFSIKAVLIYYFGPYLFVNAWLVLITFLHHTDANVPHYRDGSWTYVKGALATIDRDYGTILNHVHHNIGDTHVAHHLFSRIPHYNAKKVTEIIKPLLGKHYNFDESFFLKALWINHYTCRYVPDDGDVLYFEKPTTHF